MIQDIRDIALNMLDATWPMLVISCLVATVLRITYLVTNGKKFVLYEELLKLFFIIYILCLFQIVTAQDVSFGGVNIIPFKEIFRYVAGTYLFYKNILGNVLLFLPFGFFVGYFIKVKKVSVMLLLTFIVSLSIETIQLSIGRVFDVDDIILNVLGATFGALLYIILDGIRDKLPSALNKEWFMNLLMIILLLVAIIYLTNIQVYLYEMVM